MGQPRTGVYVCGCQGEISKRIDLHQLAATMAKKKGVALCREHESLCSLQGLQLIEDDLRSGEIDRVVILACSPRRHEETFKAILRKAGISEYLLETSNLREQCAWVHEEAKQAYKKAAILAQMSLARSRWLEPLEPLRFTATRRVLVVGGGIAGLSASLDLAEAGVEVVLVEREAFLGGRAAQLYRYFPRLCPPGCGIDYILQKIRSNSKIELTTLTEVKSLSGGPGNFEVTLLQKPRYVMPDRCTACGNCAPLCPADRKDHFDFGLSQTKAIYLPKGFPHPQSYVIDPDRCLGQECSLCRQACPVQAIDLEESPRERTIKVGSIIVATGWDPFDARLVEQFGYQQYPDVINNMEFERLVSPSGPTGGKLVRLSNGQPVKRIAFIQCVGSRDKNHLPYCSKVCCTVTLKQIKYVREFAPEAQIFVFYMDMRATGEYEEMYRLAQEESQALFIRGIPSRVIEDINSHDLILQAEDTLSGQMVKIGADMVVLATGMTPNQEFRQLGERVGLPLEMGAFASGHLQCFPFESRRAGIYAAGTSQEPMDASSAIKSAAGAAMKALVSLPEEIVIRPTVPVLDKTKCDKCKRCMEECPFGAWGWDDAGYPSPNLLQCRQCGICQGGCPMKVIALKHSTVKQTASMVEAFDPSFLGEREPTILAFLCYNDAYPAVDAACEKGLTYPANLVAIRVPCAGSLNVALVADALAGGADGIIVAGCASDQCHFVRGSDLAKTRLQNMQETLQRMMLEAQRVKWLTLNITDTEGFVRTINDFVAELRRLGPNPFKG